MPRFPDKPCAHPGCAKLVPRGTMYCEKHAPLHPRRRPMDQDDRPSAAARGYTRAWQCARRGFLAENPLCAECMKEGRYVRATVVDHIIPHRGDEDLFWNRDNWQSLCKHHHDMKTNTTDKEYIKTHPWKGKA